MHDFPDPEVGEAIPYAELATVPTAPHRFHGEWNYTIVGTPLRPRRKRTTTT